jgi:drug/metabolite transporter (DMT)-like permease
MGSGEWGLMSALALLWGSSFFWFKVLGAALPPLTIIAIQLSIAGVILNAVTFGRGLGWPPRRWWRPLLVLGLVSNTLPYSLLIYGETKIPSGLASIFGAVTPVVAAAVAHLFTHDEKLTRPKLAAVLLGFAGVAVLVGPAAFAGGGKDALLGQLACFTVAVIYGCAVVYGRRFAPLPALQVAAGEITAAALLTVPLALAFDRPWSLPPPPLPIWAALVGLALFSTALAYLLYYRLLARAGAVNVSVVTVLTPVAATALGVLFLHERLELRSLAGLLLIALGIAFLDGRPIAWAGRTLKPPPSA